MAYPAQLFDVHPDAAAVFPAWRGPAIADGCAFGGATQSTAVASNTERTMRRCIPEVLHASGPVRSRKEPMFSCAPAAKHPTIPTESNRLAKDQETGSIE